MKKIKTDVFFFEQIVMPPIKFMILFSCTLEASIHFVYGVDSKKMYSVKKG